MNLNEAKEGAEYVIERVATGDEETDAFLFSLGCYAGEKITLISRHRKIFVVAMKDTRYSIDTGLAKTILVQS